MRMDAHKQMVHRNEALAYIDEAIIHLEKFNQEPKVSSEIDAASWWVHRAKEFLASTSYHRS
jgi:hypothetical protein